MREERGRFSAGPMVEVAAREKRPGDLVTDADLASQRWIAAQLRSRFPPHTARRGRRSRSDPSCPWRWVVDPLDGTINFAHRFPFWAVSIALGASGPTGGRRRP